MKNFFESIEKTHGLVLKQVKNRNRSNKEATDSGGNISEWKLNNSQLSGEGEPFDSPSLTEELLQQTVLESLKKRLVLGDVNRATCDNKARVIHKDTNWFECLQIEEEEKGSLLVCAKWCEVENPAALASCATPMDSDSSRLTNLTEMAEEYIKQVLLQMFTRSRSTLG